MTMLLYDTPLSLRRRFIQDFAGITGTGNAKALWIAGPSDGLTSVDNAVPTRVWTQANTPNGRTFGLGRGSSIQWNGTSDAVTCPDATDLSFGDGATDVAFSAFVVAFCASASRTFLAKNGEYSFGVDASSKLLVQLVDASVPAVPFRTQDTASTRIGSWASFGFTYTKATGGATAANDILIYENGRVVASTATNVGTYVAMENGTSVPTIGALNGGASGWLSGALAVVAIITGALTATQHALLHDKAQALYGLRP